MKVLWFTNIMLPVFASRVGGEVINQEGWLTGLVGGLCALAQEIELTIVCIGFKNVDTVINGVRYVAFEKESPGETAVFIRKIAPDVIHIHGTEGRWVSWSSAVWGSIPVVASIQGILNGCYPHYTGNLLPMEVWTFAGLANKLITRWSVFHGGEVWRRKKSPTEAEAFLRIRHFLGRTLWDRAWTSYLNPNAKYYEVGEILRPVFYLGGRSSATVIPHTIFCGGAFAYPLKGGHWLLKAIVVLRRKYPDIQLRVANAIRIKSPRGLRAWLQQGEYHRYLSRMIDAFDLRANVVLLPSLTAEEVAEELKRAELFCLPSLCENSPNSLGEAMLMGVPCIATDVGGTETILKKGEQGMLVPSGDPAILAYWIDKLFSDKELACRFAKAGQADALVRYRPERVVQQLVNAYQAVLKAESI